MEEKFALPKETESSKIIFLSLGNLLRTSILISLYYSIIVWAEWCTSTHINNKTAIGQLQDTPLYSLHVFFISLYITAIFIHMFCSWDRTIEQTN